MTDVWEMFGQMYKTKHKQKKQHKPQIKQNKHQFVL